MINHTNLNTRRFGNLLMGFVIALVSVTGCFAQARIDNSGAAVVIPWSTLYFFPGFCVVGQRMTYTQGIIGASDYECGEFSNWIPLPPALRLKNDATTGTLLNKLATINTAGQVIAAGTGDTAIPVYVVVADAGTTRNATLATIGLVNCIFDAGGGAAGNFVVASTTTAAACHDAGSTAPTSGWIIGKVQTAAAPGVSGTIALVQGYNGAAGGSTTIAASGVTPGTYPAGAFIYPSGLSFGSSAPTCTAGTGGASCSGEGTAPSVGSAAGVDVCYADSSSHKILCSWNNGSYFPITQTIASGATALGTGSISSASCGTVVTATATGTLSTDAISWAPNGSIKAVTGYIPATTGGLTIAAYPGSGNVNFDVCNWTSGSITPGAITINWRVSR